EPGLGARTIYIDQNGNGTLDAGETSTVTDTAGHYYFDGLAAGTYTIRSVVTGTWQVTAPASGYYSVTLTAPTDYVVGRDFGLHKPPYVVTNANNSGAGSFREAIALANDDIIPDVITFDPVVFATPQ